ncbi:MULTISPECIES: hypothetical protein [Micrococcaceae]|uniref:hypothetical protein n=1 Tax=Micrococcaceae TaxID=1268 RepID=UPI0019105F3D|nr:MULTISPECIES: hypothetical protein [Micrococcaceae]
MDRDQPHGFFKNSGSGFFALQVLSFCLALRQTSARFSILPGPQPEMMDSQ